MNNGISNLRPNTLPFQPPGKILSYVNQQKFFNLLPKDIFIFFFGSPVKVVMALKRILSLRGIASVKSPYVQDYLFFRQLPNNNMTLGNHKGLPLQDGQP
ncbi:MAG: hypothetical protein DRR19_01620 [Candidatus Parabeggiatoa sp. nov. 1]|nr:MAG: hypothetical protein DRR19_01620 [Gammaproteobacteria bacterium]